MTIDVRSILAIEQAATTEISGRCKDERWLPCLVLVRKLADPVAACDQ